MINIFLAIIFFLLPTYLIRFSVFNIPTTLLEILIYIVFVISLIGIKPKLKNLKSWIWIPIAALEIAAIISIFIAPDKILALGQWKALFFDPLLIFILILANKEEIKIKWLFGGLVASGVYISIYSIWLRFWGDITEDGRVVGLFGYSPNYVALYLAPIIVLLLLSVIWLATKKKYFLVAVGSLSSTVCLIALYFSGSRGGILAVVTGIIAYLILVLWPKFKNKILTSTVIGILILVSIFALWQNLKPNFNISGASGGREASSNNVRWQIWETSIEIIKQKPVIGVGLGNYQNYFENLTKNRINFSAYIIPWALTPHNLLLMFYLSTGLLGLISFLAILFFIFYFYFKNSSPTKKIIISVITAILVFGLVDTPYFKNDLALIFWLLVPFML